jgi:hypothetical protein
MRSCRSVIDLVCLRVSELLERERESLLTSEQSLEPANLMELDSTTDVGMYASLPAIKTLDRHWQYPQGRTAGMQTVELLGSAPAYHTVQVLRGHSSIRTTETHYAPKKK